MQKLIHKKNNILIDSKSNMLLNHGKVETKKHSNKIDCVEYNGFLEEMKILIDKVDSNDLSDFEEF